MRSAARALVDSRLRLALAAAAVAACGTVIVAAFWMQDWRYSLPTPRPSGLRQAALGSTAVLPPALASLACAERPLFLHFYRPACPCSRFNLEHVRALERKHGGEASFVLVLEGDDRDELERAYERMDWPVAHVDDVDGEIADALGVYSTPQAVIVDSAGRLAYRGNYNTTRYCTDARTEFARLALEDVLEQRAVRPLPCEATLAYGCSLPSDLAEAAP